MVVVDTIFGLHTYSFGHTAVQKTDAAESSFSDDFKLVRVCVEILINVLEIKAPPLLFGRHLVVGFHRRFRGLALDKMNSWCT